MKNIFTFFALIFATTVNISASGAYAGKHSLKTGLMNFGKNYVSNPERSADVLIPWLNSSSDLSVLAPCPGNIVENLKPGECGKVIPSFGFAFPDITPSNLTFNQNTDQFSINGTIFCNVGQTKYSRTFLHGGPTDLRITSVNLGVYQSVNFPIVKINIYSSPGNVLLGSHLAAIPDLNTTVYTINIPNNNIIKVPANSSFRIEIVANAPHISVFKIGSNNGGHLASFTNATVVSSCANLMSEGVVPDPVNNSIVFGVSGLPDDYKIVNTNPQTVNLKEGDFFPIGNHTMSYVVYDAFGNVGIPCPFSITINEFPNPTGAIACNDLVQVSLGEDCQTIVTPQMLLEGNNYGCYNKYTVQIIGNNGAILGNKVTKANIGQTLKTQIIGPNGNSCWGEILVQDKYGPNLICDTVYATCATDLRPGKPLSEVVPVAAKIIDGTLSAGSPNINTFIIPVGQIKGSTITDLDVYMDISHDRISDIAANITSPDGVTVPLFLQQAACNTGKNLMASFDDGAVGPISCEASVVPAISGRFKPHNPLSIFNGKPMGGNWLVTVYDLSNGVGGKVNNIHLIFKQSGGVVRFPTLKPITFINTSDNEYVVTGLDDCSNATLSYTDSLIRQDCQDIYSKVIKRCWAGFDDKGNQANSCCQLIYVYRNSLSTLVFPPNYDGLNGNPEPLSCVIFGDSIPPVELTGFPKGDLCNNVQIIPPTDIKIDLCPRSYKLLRSHKVIDWCSGNVIIHNQIIKVLDREGPELTCPSNLTISTDNFKCSATYKVPKPAIGVECSDVLSYFLEYRNDEIAESPYVSTNVNQTTGTITNLPLGSSTMRWIVTDQCGNSSSCTFKVKVIDDVRPNAVCDIYTVASITGTGKAIVNATTFDDGSTDNCGILRFDARKMTDACGFGTSIFTPTVEFCCEEVNTSVMVEMRVTDVHGNSNTCMVEVRVADKLPPYITHCPPDIILDCQADYKDLKVTGEPLYVDNCGVDSVWYKDTDSISRCGTGIVTRVWTVKDKQNYRNSCVQVITLIDSDPFYVNIKNYNDPYDDIEWPKNYETKKCRSLLSPADLPEGYNKPTWTEDNCSLVAAHYKDQVFKFADGACEKILRTWTVLDWCTYNEASPVYGHGWYEYVQIIKLLNDVPPIFEFSCVDRTIPSYGACQDVVDFTMTAIDDCPEDNINLIWKYELFTQNGVIPIKTKYTNRFLDTLANGKYRVKWTVEDRCGNKAFCTHTIDLIENKKPTPYCITSLTTAVMNSNGTAEIWAKDYDKGGYDNCTPKDSLWFTFYDAKPVDTLKYIEHYFKGNGVKATKAEYESGKAQVWKPLLKTSGLRFSCSDIPNGKSHEISLNVSLTDLAGNQDYCTIILVLQDNADFCPDINVNFASISGKISAGSAGMAGSDITLGSNFSELNKTIKSDANGNFSFNTLPTTYNYNVGLSDNRDIMNGVSTLDLVMIQRHILGVETLNDPKKIIAADVDNNGRVTASDLLNLRKNILGIAQDFPNGQKSWRFVTSNHEFSNKEDPFPYTEKYTYNLLADSKSNQNFYAIKIGDVNNSAIVNANDSQAEPRSNRTFALEAEIRRAKGTDELLIPVYAASFTDVLGYQFTLHFDQELLEFKEVLPVGLELNESNFGLHNISKGIITTSWNSSEPVILNSETPLFTLKFKLKSAVEKEIKLRISSDITRSEAYDVGLNSMDIRFTILGNQNLANDFELRQNIPNPFKENTQISFVLPEAAKAKITISDIAGKVIKTISGTYNKGENSITLNKQDLGASGILLYKIESGIYLDTKKMIIIE
jgi:subtilisin-like proprotein convertase family protein